MNRQSLIALAIVAVSGAAFANDYTANTTPFVSTLTRAEVQAELVRSNQTGINAPSDWYSSPVDQTISQRSRGEASAEYIAQRDRVAAFTGDDSGSAYLAQQRADRASVLAGQPAAAH